MQLTDVFAQLGLSVLERGWLSSNNIVFGARPGISAALVDTGYVAHEEQTCALVAPHLGGSALGRVLNTHLHSDHCGGNAALQAAWDCEVWVPEPSFDAVATWDESRLSFEATDQRCRQFGADQSLRAGDRVALGSSWWEVIAAPGHDPDAVMFFQRESGVIITADALWQDRLAINFPELSGEPGFGAARSALDCIEALAPRVCIPGHGAPFTDIGGAIARSRRRLDQFESDPGKHIAYAERALTVFHMLECRTAHHEELVSWLASAPVFRGVHERLGQESPEPIVRAREVVDRLVRDGLLRQDSDGTLHAQ